MPSRLTSQYAPDAECIPRLPISPDPPAALLSMTPCWTMVLFTVKRYGAGFVGGFSEADSAGVVATMSALRTEFYCHLLD